MLYLILKNVKSQNTHQIRVRVVRTSEYVHNVCDLKSLIATSIPPRMYVKAQQMPSGIVTTENSDPQFLGHFGYVSHWLFCHLIYDSKKCTEYKLSNLLDKRPNLSGSQESEIGSSFPVRCSQELRVVSHQWSWRANLVPRPPLSSTLAPSFSAQSLHLMTKLLPSPSLAAHL